MPAQRFEPMTVGQILDRAFTLYRNNFIHFIAVMAIVLVPMGFLAYAVIQPVATAVEESQANPYGSEDPSSAVIGSILLFLLLSGVAVLLCFTALTKSVSDAYLGDRPSVGGTYRAVLSRLLALIGLIIMLWLVGVGLMVPLGVLARAFGVVGAWLALLLLNALFLRLMLSSQALLLERIGPLAAIKRSWSLTSRNFWRSVGLAILLNLIFFVVYVVFLVAFGLIARLLGGVSPAAAFSATFLLMFGAGVFATPIWAGAFILLYYDLRIRKEGFDLQMLAQNLESAAQEAPEHGVPPVQY